uniref:Uncharacterized protein n=2 Tax=Oryza TaxID=4527 RepID=A0A0E0QUR4_ORYRU
MSLETDSSRMKSSLAIPWIVKNTLRMMYMTEASDGNAEELNSQLYSAQHCLKLRRKVLDTCRM